MSCYELHRKIRNSERIFYYFFLCSIPNSVFHCMSNILNYRENIASAILALLHNTNWIFSSNVYLIYFHMKLTYNVIISFRQVNKHLHFFSSSVIRRWNSKIKIIVEYFIGNNNQKNGHKQFNHENLVIFIIILFYSTCALINLDSECFYRPNTKLFLVEWSRVFLRCI